ncbi:hypothetical protein Tco_0953705 [Tanacetum coccineum]|uniref:Uncharacterized protein n=1 Tax=Tanacetum coccineum TaxID=301880 RepID=A0ABQ5E0M1_9ASTR
MSADVARGHGDDGGGDDRPPTHHIPTGYGGCFVNRDKGTRKPNLGGRKAGRLHTRQETRNLGLKKITDDKGPVPIRFEWDDKKIMMPLGDHASHWSNYLGELIREMSLYYPSWQKVPTKRKAAIVTKIETQFDLKPHMQSQRWTNINAGIQQHLQKLHRQIGMPSLPFRMIPGTKPEPLKIAKTGQRAWSYAGRDPGHLLAFEIRWDGKKTQTQSFWGGAGHAYRHCARKDAMIRSPTGIGAGLGKHLAPMERPDKIPIGDPGVFGAWFANRMESSSTREYPSLIHTFFVTHTVGGVFVWDEDRALYDEMLRLQRLGSNTETGVPYTEEEIMAIVRKGKQRGHLPGVGRVLSGRATGGCPPPPQSTVDPADVEKLKKSNKSLTKQVKMMMRLFRSDDKFSQMLDQFESSPEFGGASGSGGCGDDEPGGDEDGDEDEEDGDS